MTSQDDRWDFLAPWCDRVRGLLSIRSENVTSWRSDFPSWPAIIEVHYSPREGDPGLRAIRESLVLLTLVVQADPSAWMSVLVKRCDLQASHDLIKSNVPRLISFAFYLFAEDPEDILEHLFDNLEAPPSAEFAAAVREVAARGGSDRVQRTRQWDIPISVSGSNMLDYDDVWGTLKHLRSKHGGWRFPIRVAADDDDDDESDRTSANATRGSHQLDCAFVVNLDGIDFFAFGDDDYEMMSALKDTMINGEGLRIAEMKVDAMVEEPFESFDAACTSQQGGHTFERVLCASSSARSSLATVDELNLDCEQMPPAQLARMCSAIANARTTRQLSVELSDHQGIRGSKWEDYLTPWKPWMWKHLAYALFRGRSSITHVSVTNVHLTEDATEAMASVINSSDPIRELYGSSASATMKLKEGTRLQMLPMNDADEILDESAHWQLATDVDNVVVLESASTDDQDVAKVVVPGYGLCEVARGELVTTSEDDINEDLSRGITSLDLNFGWKDSREGLGHLLKAIGGSLAHLRISEGWNFGDVLRWCPALKVLSIDMPVDAELFVRACRDGTPRLEELCCVFDSLSVVIDELASSDSNLAQTLKQMVCWPKSTSDLDAIAVMLSVNRTLEFIRVRLPRDLTGVDVDGIQHFHDQVILGTRAPLSIKCRLAFLSVFAASRRGIDQAVKRSKTESSSPVMPVPLMDHNVLSIIFEFAADNVHRQICIDTSG